MNVHSAETLFLESVDDYLGPGESRFFGAGYRRVRYHLRDAALDTAGPGGPGLRAAVGVEYPADWSTKAAGTDLRPHLSTLDALILAVRAAEFLARHAHGLDPRRQAAAWLRRVDIKAASSAVEERLADLPVTARHSGDQEFPDGSGRVASSYDCRVAAMRARVELVHERGGPLPGAAPAAEELGAGYPGLYGAGFHHQRQSVRDVTVDVAARRADASVLVSAPAGHPALAGGVESAHGPVVSMIDSFAVALQLGQILLYETDRITRAESDTLWMRHTTLTAGPAGTRPVGEPFPVTTLLEDSTLIEAGGATWRTAVITGACLGVRTRCSVTHRLPAHR